MLTYLTYLIIYIVVGSLASMMFSGLRTAARGRKSLDWQIRNPRPGFWLRKFQVIWTTIFWPWYAAGTLGLIIGRAYHK